MKKIINSIILSCIAFSAMAWLNQECLWEIFFHDGRHMEGMTTCTTGFNWIVFDREHWYFYFNDNKYYDINMKAIENFGVTDLITEHAETHSPNDGHICFKNVRKVNEWIKPKIYNIYFTDGKYVKSIIHQSKKYSHPFTSEGEKHDEARFYVDSEKARCFILKQISKFEVQEHVKSFQKTDEGALLVLMGVSRVENSILETY